MGSNVCERTTGARTRDPGVLAAMPAHDRRRPLVGLLLMLPWTERRRSKGEKPQESWGSGDGSPTSPGSRDPEARMERDVTPFKGVRGDPAIKARIGSGGNKLWRGETPRRDRRPAHGKLASCASASARTRRGMKALKTALHRPPTLSGEGRTSEVTAGGHRAPRGVPIAVEGNPLQGEAHGCSSTLRRAGRRVAPRGASGRKVGW